MQSKTDIGLTSAEISGLWRTFQSDSMSIRVFKYFLEKVKDSDTRPIIEYALSLSEQHIRNITEIFNKEGYPIPQGFTDEDVDVTAPPLYSDIFCLFYIRNMSRIGLESYSLLLPQVTRQDVLDFFTGCVNTSIELTRKVIFAKLSKGVYIRPPMISIPEKIDFIDNKSFLTGFFGEKRNMTAGEITALFLNIQSNAIGLAMLTGFAQVAESEKVRVFMIRGKNIANKHIEIFSSRLESERIPVSLPSDTFVTNSTDAPFSDKLMMFHTNLMISTGLGNYGTAMTICMRHDLQADFVRLAAETAKYGADGLNIMIDNSWMEQPPQAINHDALSNVKHE